MSIFLILAFSFTQARAENLFPFSADQNKLNEQIAIISESYLGSAFLFSPLGEGFGVDSDPLIRFDVFDCTTFVETVGALALTDNSGSSATLDKLTQIRYSRMPIAFENRNHFTSADWIPNNVAKGLLSDLTRQLFPNNTRQITTHIERSAWFKKNFDLLNSSSSQHVQIDLVRISNLIAVPDLMKRIPQGAVINFISTGRSLKNKIGTDLDVGHQGLAIWKSGQLFLRHASQTDGKVVDVLFFQYLQIKQNSHLLGLNINLFRM